MESVLEQLKSARAAWASLSQATTGVKNLALREMAEGLAAARAEILAANGRDLDEARQAGLTGALLSRLELTDKKIEGMVRGIRDVEALEDPIGRSLSTVTRPNGLQITKMSVPLGVLAVIYESRPNVTSDVAALAVKSGNSIILRGGKESLNSNRAIAGILRKALVKAGLPADCVQLIPTPDREAVQTLLTATDLLDLVIPRGGESLIRTIVENSRVPVIFQYKGVCHTFVDESADLKMALEVVVNAKTSNPAVCNALECLLIHRSAAARILPALAERLKEWGVEVRADGPARSWMPGAVEAKEGDFGREFLDLVLAVKVVDSLEEALAHIQKYGSRHSEAILTNDYANAQVFLKRVDAACVYVNASTRFTDGGEFGFGAEVGISTQKLHARGPMGLAELTTTKYLILGSGQVR
ncbi:MAG TPA: glutamate-5-semialdehyde dehydrogenase [bacterium]|nr:glutamate-5-semialdehyde dehydrogenase [bacterium]